jgi:hypothetical protein
MGRRLLEVDPPTPEAAQLWQALADLAEAIGDAGDWCLIGGLMVHLHAVEHRGESRSTMDIDLLGNARTRPSMTERLASTLKGLGAAMAMPSVTSPQTGYVFELDGAVVEVLGSEGLEKDPNTIGAFTTIQVAGSNQALRRAELVALSVSGGDPVPIRVPSLLGAILLKARAMHAAPRKLGEHRQDLIRLLSFVAEPRELAASGGITGNEKGWLSKVKPELDWDDPDLTALFSRDALANARQAYILLCQ